MKIVIEGNYKKVKQIHKELVMRCKKDKVMLTIDVPKEEPKEVIKRTVRTKK